MIQEVNENCEIYLRHPRKFDGVFSRTYAWREHMRFLVQQGPIEAEETSLNLHRPSSTIVLLGVFTLHNFGRT